eukprot:CAMPEP_0113505506 /NCGR_PEP_ID=MMETSP0014_2-20120614/35359_1 /TAXON_ID=2857 /ORGANISM="Nitzschia sp." /LENGTH=477 /DNA_ID=CAMNT_0000400835 /DNA_START=179 /DNA_END=1608 /DNA_ORIENTATION=+ /assembly_acc=CAM_ASM_000159
MAKCNNNNENNSDTTKNTTTTKNISSTTTMMTGGRADDTTDDHSFNSPNGDDDSYDNEDDDTYDDTSTKVSSMEDMARKYIERRFVRGSSLFSSTSSVQDDADDDDTDQNNSDKNASSSSIKSTSSATASSKRSVHDPILQDIPDVVRPDGINICGTLGKGSFAIVHEITMLPEASSSSSSTTPQTQSVASLPNNDQLSSSQRSDCGSISVHEVDKGEDSDCDTATIQKDDTQESTEQTAFEDSLSSSSRSYALKRIHPKVIKDDDDEEKVWGRSIDIACEAMMLSVLSHPNIVRMHGTSGQWGDQHNFGIVLDRLQWSLKEQILRWSTQHPHKTSLKTPRSLFNSTFFPKSYRRNDPSEETTLSRLEALYDVAKGMEYLHERSIIYRDLKLANIALNEETGKFCLIDFGLARELKPSDRVVDGGDSSTESLYRLTGMTGTPSYCAPEVLRCKWYGLSADVYSFAIVFWEVMALKRT